MVCYWDFLSLLLVFISCYLHLLLRYILSGDKWMRFLNNCFFERWTLWLLYLIIYLLNHCKRKVWNSFSLKLLLFHHFFVIWMIKVEHYLWFVCIRLCLTRYTSLFRQAIWWLNSLWLLFFQLELLSFSVEQLRCGRDRACYLTFK